jgi:DNA invertase Pin-like site-specific DNA recombinase
MEGIAAAEARGVYKGGKRSIDAAEVKRLHADERLGPAAIARRLGISCASVYQSRWISSMTSGFRWTSNKS